MLEPDRHRNVCEASRISSPRGGGSGRWMCLIIELGDNFPKCLPMLGHVSGFPRITSPTDGTGGQAVIYVSQFSTEMSYPRLIAEPEERRREMDHYVD